MKITDDELLEELRFRIENHKKTISELKDASKELKEVNDKLNESESLKSHFISNITNELINPFASILALSTEILEMKEADWSKVKFMTSLIHTETFYLDFQLRNIFAAARIEAGEAFPEINNVEINSLISNTMDLFISETTKRNILINYNKIAEQKIKTDPSKLKLIIINLLSNAVKFSKNNSEVSVTIEFKDSKLSLKVHDNGIGIPDNFKNNIFDRFSKYDSTINSVIRGQGLGLSIVKAYIDILEGTIKVESEQGKGTTVTFVIPESNVESNDFADGNELIFDEGDIF